jgi:hypothetical protein
VHFPHIFYLDCSSNLVIDGLGFVIVLLYIPFTIFSADFPAGKYFSHGEIKENNYYCRYKIGNKTTTTTITKKIIAAAAATTTPSITTNSLPGCLFFCPFYGHLFFVLQGSDNFF